MRGALVIRLLIQAIPSQGRVGTASRHSCIWSQSFRGDRCQPPGHRPFGRQPSGHQPPAPGILPLMHAPGTRNSASASTRYSILDIRVSHLCTGRRPICTFAPSHSGHPASGPRGLSFPPAPMSPCQRAPSRLMAARHKKTRHFRDGSMGPGCPVPEGSAD